MPKRARRRHRPPAQLLRDRFRPPTPPECKREVDGKPEYTAARAGSGTVLLVRDYQYTRLDKPGADLLDKPTPAAAAAPAGNAPPAPQLEEEDDGDEAQDDEGLDDEADDAGEQ